MISIVYDYNLVNIKVSTEEYLHGWFRDRRVISSSLKMWLKSPEGYLYTHITIIHLSIVAICAAHISKIVSLQYLEKSR